MDEEKSSLVSTKNYEKRFGQSPVFVASTLLEHGGVHHSATAGSLLKEAIHVISCGYEDKTEWGKEVGFRLREIVLSCLGLFSSSEIVLNCVILSMRDRLGGFTGL